MFTNEFLSYEKKTETILVNGTASSYMDIRETKIFHYAGTISEGKTSSFHEDVSNTLV